MVRSPVRRNAVECAQRHEIFAAADDDWMGTSPTRDAVCQRGDREQRRARLRSCGAASCRARPRPAFIFKFDSQTTGCCASTASRWSSSTRRTACLVSCSCGGAVAGLVVVCECGASQIPLGSYLLSPRRRRLPFPQLAHFNASFYSTPPHLYVRSAEGAAAVVVRVRDRGR